MRGAGENGELRVLLDFEGGFRLFSGGTGSVSGRVAGSQASPRYHVDRQLRGDPGTGGCNSTECTLREAINTSNGLPTTDTIRFAIPDDPTIPGPDVKTISPTSQLPAITDNVTIDGYTQEGAEPNDAITNANNAVLKVELSGLRPNGSRLAASGLAVSEAGTTIKGLVINRFGGDGIVIDAPEAKIVGNFIGTNAASTADLGNGGDGVRIESSDNLVGGPANAAQNVSQATTTTASP